MQLRDIEGFSYKEIAEMLEIDIEFSEDQFVQSQKKIERKLNESRRLWTLEDQNY